MKAFLLLNNHVINAEIETQIKKLSKLQNILNIKK